MVWLRAASVAVHFQEWTSAPQCCIHFVPVDEASADVEVLKFMWSAEKETQVLKWFQSTAGEH